MSVEKFGKNSVIFVEGEESKDLIIIKSGQVRIVKEKNKSLDIIGVRKTKEFLGEHSLFFGTGSRTLSAIAEDDVEIIRIPYDELKEVLETCSIWVKNLMETLFSRSKSLHTMLIEHRIEDDEIQKPLSSNRIPLFRDALEEYREEKGIPLKD